MRSARLATMLSVVTVLSGLLALNLRAQFRTQEKIDALAAVLATRPDLATRQAAQPGNSPAPGVVPRELDHPTLPPYIIEPPDVLTIEAVLKKPELDVVECLPNQPISGSFVVRPDGTVGLGLWGSVSVTGLTPDQAADAIRAHLAKSVESEMSTTRVAVGVDVLAYNSKRYYVIIDSPDGEQVLSFPVTGNETVLDAISQVNGLPDVAGKRTIRIARKTPGSGPYQVLPVDWNGITQHGITATNYQLMPADRLYITASQE